MRSELGDGKAIAYRGPGVRTRIVFLLARLILNFLGIVTTAVLTRLLEPAEYGLYALGMSVLLFLTIGVFEWLGLSLLRLGTTTGQPERFFGTIAPCFCALCGLCAIAAAVALAVADLGNQALLAWACLAATFAAAWFELSQRLQLAELRGAAFLRAAAVRGAATTLLPCAAAYFSGSAPVIVLASGAGFLIGAAAAWEPRLNLLRWRFDWSICRALLRYGFPLSVSVGLATLLISVDKWLLQALLGPREVGLYSAAAFVAQIPIQALAFGIGSSSYSLAVQAVEFRSAEAARDQLRQNFTVLLGVVLPAAAGIVALSGNLAHVMVGNAYWEAVVRLTPWLAAAAVFASLRAFYLDFAFQLASRTAPLIWMMLVTVAVNVVLDLWLIPTNGELGAAIGSCCAFLVGLVVTAIASRSVYRLPLPLAEPAKIAASVAVMFAVLCQLSGRSGAAALGGQIAIGALVYAGGLLAGNVLGMRDRLLRRAVAV
jgi:O-antigen/teichoic acid export membrane protein